MFRHLRILLTFAAFFCLMNLSGNAADNDPVKERVFKAKEEYTSDISKLRADTLAWFEKKEDKAREDADRKLVEEIKLQRGLFNDSEEWPSDMPPGLRTRLQKSRAQLEGVFATAIKDYLKAKKDDEAAGTEKDLEEFRRSFCPLLDLAKAQPKDGYFHIPPNTLLLTKNAYKGGIEITLVAKTEGDDIRLHAHMGSTVIFNWENNHSELRVCRPDGNDLLESGSIIPKKVTPLRANTYYTLKWRLTPEGMTVSNNGTVVFAEKKVYNLDSETKIGIGVCRSVVDIKEFRLTRFVK